MSRIAFTTPLLLALALPTIAGCSFMARDQETYRADTRTVLEQNKAKVKSCYDAALANNEDLSGQTVVKFTVQAKTGNFVNASIDPSSTAPESLNQCILDTVQGLQLEPFDQRDGNATFTWKFKSGRQNA